MSIHEYLSMDLLVAKCSDRWQTILRMVGALHPFVDLAYRTRYRRAILTRYWRKREARKLAREGVIVDWRCLKVDEAAFDDISASQLANDGLYDIIRNTINCRRPPNELIQVRGRRFHKEYYIDSAVWRNRVSKRNQHKGDNVVEP